VGKVIFVIAALYAINYCILVFRYIELQKMNRTLQKYVSIVLSTLVLFIVSPIFVRGAESSSFYNNNDKKVVLLSKDEETDKNITNVKVGYNPVVAQISVSFKLSKDSHVSIKLMDALGNEILNLSNSTMEEGTHSLSFDKGEKVTEGFYFVRIIVGTDVVVKRVSIR